MKIVKRQSGGPSYLTYTPVDIPISSLSWASIDTAKDRKVTDTAASASSSTSSGSSSKSDDNIGLLTKDMVKMLYENALPNDVREFLSKVDIFGSNLNPNDPNAAAVMESKYKLLLSILPELKFNKELYTEAVTKAMSNNVMDLPAISLAGGVFVMRSNGIQEIAVKDLKKGERAITNAELAKLRAYSQDYAFDRGGVTSILDNGTSLKDVFNSIKDATDNLGTLTQEEDYTITKDGDKIKSTNADRKRLAGYQLLLAEAEDGVYKEHSKQSTLQNNASLVLSYILATLPKNQQTLLEYIAKTHGLPPEQGAKLIIQSYIQGRVSDTVEYGLEAVKLGDIDGSGSGSGSGSGQKWMDWNQAQHIITGDGLQHVWESVKLGDSQFGFHADVQKLPTLVEPGSSGKAVGASTLGYLLSNTQLGGVVDQSSIHIGNQLVSTAELSRIYYAGDGAETMVLPIKQDANGKTQPNWDLIKQYEKATQQMQQQGLLNKGGQYTKEDVAKINKIFHANGLGDYLEADGSLNPDMFQRFAVIDVYGDEESFESPDDNEDFYFDVNSKQQDAVRNAMKQLTNKTYESDGNIKKARAFIPIYDSVSNSLIAGGNPAMEERPQAIDVMASEQAIERQKHWNNSGDKNKID